MDGCPQNTTEFLFSELQSAPEGAMMHVCFKQRSISQWNLNKVKWRTLYKKGCRQFHPNNTSSKEQRNSREAQSLSLSPPPQVLAFDLPTSVTERCSYHSILFSGIWESKLWRKSSLWGGLSNLIKDHSIWQTPQGKPSCPHVLAPPGWVQVSRWIA